jgi:hypothetical protein
VPHTFWNPTDQPTRLLEIISPAGFENYFRELGESDGPKQPPGTSFQRLGPAGSTT